MFRRTVACGVALALSLGCMPAGDPTAGYAAATAEDEYVTKAMTGPQNGPPEADDEISAQRYVADGLQIAMKAEDRNTRFGWGLPAIGSGAHVEADIRFATDMPSDLAHNPYAGVVCADTSPKAVNLPRYLLAIEPSGRALMIRVTGTGASDITRIADASGQPAISARGTNHIVADCITGDGEDVLTLTVNGSRVLQFVDRAVNRVGIVTAAGIEVVTGSQKGFTVVVSGFRAGPIVKKKGA